MACKSLINDKNYRVRVLKAKGGWGGVGQGVGAWLIPPRFCECCVYAVKVGLGQLFIACM